MASHPPNLILKMTSLSNFLAHSRQRVNQFLQQALEHQQSPFVDRHNAALQRLQAASLYSISNGGKRLRPALIYAVADSFGTISERDQDRMAAAMECIHSYSLVHDDLPAMDNDSLRRGKPTCHIAYDEATAILVGDGLQAFAFELLSQLEIAPTIALRLVTYLAQAAGNLGMVGGQMVDLQSVNRQLNLSELEYMHRLKTGALIQASVMMPALAAQTDEKTQTALTQYAQAIGLAFQVQDDILDVESDTATLGKTQGSDQQHNKPTYPALLGLTTAKEKANELIAQAHLALEETGQDCDRLHELADFITQRHS